MSVDQAAAAVLSQIALAADGAVLGLALAYVAIRSIIKFTVASSALRKIHDAPSVRVSDLRSLLSSSDQNSNESDSGRIVIVRGSVEAKSAVDGNWTSLRPNNALVSHESGSTSTFNLSAIIYSLYSPFSLHHETLNDIYQALHLFTLLSIDQLYARIYKYPSHIQLTSFTSFIKSRQPPIQGATNSRKLEPMPADMKLRWRKEVDWLLSVTDYNNYIVEFVPSQQKSKDGTNMEVKSICICYALYNP